MFSKRLLLISSVLLLIQIVYAEDDQGSGEIDWSSNGGPDSMYNCERAGCDAKYDDALLPNEEISTSPGQTRLVICDGSKHGETICKALARPYKARGAKCLCPNDYGNFSKVGVCELDFPDPSGKSPPSTWGLCNWPGSWPENRLILCFMNGQATDPWSLAPYEIPTDV